MVRGMFALALVLLMAAFPNAAYATKKVLLLFDEDRDLPGLTIINRTVRETIRSELDEEVEFYSESLNLTRFTGPGQETVLLDYFRRRYADTHLDLIMAVLSPALDFLLRHRQTLFPTLPIVFCGVDTSELTRKTVQPNMTGALLRRAYAPSIDLALALQPHIRNVYVVGGTSIFDRKLQAIARRDLEPLEKRLRITYLTTLAMPDLLNTVAHLPPDSVILYLTIFTDAAGRAFVPHDALSLIAGSANAPTYVTVDQYVGRGAIGGNVYSTELHSRYAAQLGVRVLKGERADAIAISEAVDHTDLFDWRELERWHIHRDKLPPGSVVAFRPPSMWDLYRWYIVAGVSLVLLQSMLIVGLLISRAERRRAQSAMLESELRRRRAEHELDEQREELAHALRVTTLGELAASFAHELGQPLTAILSNAQAARRFREKDPSDVEIDHALTDIAQSAKRAGDIIARLRRLFRKEHAERAPVDVNDVIYEVLRLLRTDLIQKNIDVRVTAGQGLRLLHADPVQLRQVILNVLVNAEDAIDAAPEGPREIHIATHLSDSGRIAITVRDTGVGAEESQIEHMFEHFVSTKPRGLGMGLAISRSIVEAHGGSIWATRNEGRGLTLHIELQPAPPSA